jgi:ribosomal protein S18 acetylase RimI-like enzyme
VSFVFREYRKEDKGEIQHKLIDKKRLDKYTLKTLKYKVASWLGLYRPSIYLIEEVDLKKIIGMAVLIHKVDYSLRRMEWWIEAVMVDTEKRKSGHGTMLLNNIFALLRTRGAKKAYLIFESDNDIAKSFYKKLGFTPSQRIFAMCKKPFNSVLPPYKPSLLVAVISKVNGK